MEPDKYLISLLGATAVGKTRSAIELAQGLNTVIVSFDSRQFYKEMKIGTAVPNDDELSSVPHYFIQHRSIHQDYSVGDYEKEAKDLLDHLFQEHSVIIFTGGSFLYQKAVVEGLDEFPEVSKETREELNQRVANNGLNDLVNELKEVDRESYSSIDLQNPRRVIRALEVYRASGQPFSAFKGQKPKQRNFRSLEIGLHLDRQILYERIENRVDDMIQKGLVDEVRSLIPYQHLNALQTVGYKEVFSYLDDDISKNEATELIKRNTRRYAKRQLTWLRKKPNIAWFSSSEPKNILAHIKRKIPST